MRTRSTILALLFLLMLAASSCATLSPAVTEEEEEEITAPATKWDQHILQMRQQFREQE